MTGGWKRENVEAEVENGDTLTQGELELIQDGLKQQEEYLLEFAKKFSRSTAGESLRPSYSRLRRLEYKIWLMRGCPPEEV